MRLRSLLISLATALATASPASATFIRTSGVIVDNGGLGDFFTNAFANPPATLLNSGERLYFKLEFQNAQFATADYFQEFSTFSQFWVESLPGVFDLGFGPDEGTAACSINPNGTCTISNFTLAQGTISLRHAGNVVSGYLGYDNENFDDCFGALFQAVGPICSEASGVLRPVSQSGLGDLFVGFNTPNGDGRYTFTISSSDVPEPAAWALTIAGFGVAGGALRLRHPRNILNAG